MKLFKIPTVRFALIAVTAALVLAAPLVALGAGGWSWMGWLAASLLFFITIFILLLAWRWGGEERAVLVMMVVAFLVRLVVGITLSLGLPTWGYPDNVEHQAGYIGTDAYRRDTDAWTLATSGGNLLSAFTNEYATDQYGGMLSISAFIYRFLSPDVHRPFFILILTAFASAAGIPFLWRAIKPRWGRRTALWACWILALYPDVILSGSAQMRDPFLISLIAIAFWAVSTWKDAWVKNSLVFAAGILGLLVFSWRTAVAACGAFIIFFLLDEIVNRWQSRWKTAVWIALGIAILVVAVLSFAWFREAARYDVYLTEASSGKIQAILDRLGAGWKIPFITTYGLAQPVLPAALVAFTRPVMSIIGIFRALGWYALAPLLIYALFTVWKIKSPQEKRLFIWIIGFCLIWVVVSSLRAGGDSWDNPRYRVVFLPWLALLAGWAVNRAIETRDVWLMRWLVIETIFLILSINFYLFRYAQIGVLISFEMTMLLAAIAGVAVLVGGALWDRRVRNKH